MIAFASESTRLVIYCYDLKLSIIIVISHNIRKYVNGLMSFFDPLFRLRTHLL